jgi:hypothetical protein
MRRAWWFGLALSVLGCAILSTAPARASTQGVCVVAAQAPGATGSSWKTAPPPFLQNMSPAKPLQLEMSALCSCKVHCGNGNYGYGQMTSSQCAALFIVCCGDSGGNMTCN